mgnify:CR=1 FL=1
MLRNIFLDNFNEMKNITKNNNILNNKLILNNKYKKHEINNAYYNYPIDNNNNNYIELINKNGYFNVDMSGNLNLKPVSNKKTDLQKLRTNICKFSNGELIDEPIQIKNIETYINYNNTHYTYIIKFIILFLFMFLLKYKYNI